MSKTSETAFPVTDRNGGPASGGMSLRDYFAAAALTGLLARENVVPKAASLAYAYADDMLAARERKESET